MNEISVDPDQKPHLRSLPGCAVCQLPFLGSEGVGWGERRGRVKHLIYVLKSLWNISTSYLKKKRLKFIYFTSITQKAQRSRRCGHAWWKKLCVSDVIVSVFFFFFLPLCCTQNEAYWLIAYEWKIKHALLQFATLLQNELQCTFHIVINHSTTFGIIITICNFITKRVVTMLFCFIVFSNRIVCTSIMLSYLKYKTIYSLHIFVLSYWYQVT